MTGLGREQITIGSAPNCDVVLQAPGVAPLHARIVKQPIGLALVDLGAGATFANGAPIAPNTLVPFDFRTVFAVGQTNVPLAHPAIVSMLMAQGQLMGAPRGHVVLGRDPTRATLVVAHGAVSSQHATVMLDRMMLMDHGSTSGTYVNGVKIAPNQLVPIDPNGVVAFGPIPIPITLLARIASVPPATAASPGTPAPPVVATAPQEPGGPARRHRTVIGELNMAQLQTGVITIGRTADNQIVVAHAQVSSHHAQIVRQNEALFIEDLRSANGTFVRGQRVPAGARVPIQNGEKVQIGPMPLLVQITGQQVNVVVEDAQNWAGKPLYEIEAWDLFLEVPDRDKKGQMKTLVDHVSFKALPGDLIALMGPSGAGKTTLLMTLNGYLPPSAGQVRINGEDLYAIYDAMRGSIGYVPQDDIVHPELTVFEAVKYSAQFRLPPDYSETEIDRRVEETLRSLGLEGVRNLQIGKPEKKVLSGGQRKRVNIALELVTDPVILFLDEPTSGLAADDTTALVNLLADLSKKTGKTIIVTIHQPAKDEFEKFNLCLVMGYGGIPTYFGPAGEQAYRFFGSIIERPGSPYRAGYTGHATKVDNPRDMFDMLNVRERFTQVEMQKQNPQADRGMSRLESARGWRNEYFQNQNLVFQQMYSGRRAVGTEAAMRGTRQRARTPMLRQLRLLMSRYWKVRIRDRAGAAIMFLQAPIIGIMLAIVFGGQKSAIPFWCLGALQEIAKKSTSPGSGTTNLLSEMHPTDDHTAAMFFVVVSCVWFGTSNAAREIVTERAIYLRERMVNLSLFNYVMSKYIILSLVCIFQCAMLLGIVYFAIGFNGGPTAFLLELVSMIALAMNATALGLLLSTLVTTAEAAMALTPIALIPQVVLGGLMVPMTTNAMLMPLMMVMPARWGFEGAIAQERWAIRNDPAWLIDLHQPGLQSAPDFIKDGHFQCAVAQIQADNISGAWGFANWELTGFPWAVLYGLTLVMLITLFILLKRRDTV
jgi:ABC-type multidrug transport system ATPase subunit/pSer/pThr/pTyr-binding forkhead associated (FHA) protein/ABC-type transport system involved in multi-copper enzyme maturation permease subunit